ncbi:Hypothetical predicted protein, partial [Podarcis lilfordi]
TDKRPLLYKNCPFKLTQLERSCAILNIRRKKTAFLCGPRFFCLENTYQSFGHFKNCYLP